MIYVLQLNLLIPYTGSLKSSNVINYLLITNLSAFPKSLLSIFFMVSWTLATFSKNEVD